MLRTSRTKSLKVNFYDYVTGEYSNYITENFGMTTKGKVIINYDIQAENKGNDLSSFTLFVVINEKQRSAWYDNQNLDVPSYCETPSLYRNIIYGSGSGEIIHNIQTVDKYSILMFQCWDNIYNNTIYYNLNIDMVNPTSHSKNTATAHLPIEEIMFVNLFAALFWIYAYFAIAFLYYYVTLT